MRGSRLWGTAMSPDSAAVQVEPERVVRQALATIVETYGRGIYDDPARCEAMLRDLCPGNKREVFLIVAALKERVVADLMLFGETTPADLLIARNSRKLQDSMGLSEVSARWAVETWLPPAQVLAALPPQPLPRPSSFQAVDAEEREEEEVSRQVDWRWLGWCGLAIICATLSATAIVYGSLHHGWLSVTEWLVETAALTAALAAAIAGLEQVSKRLRRMPAPQHQRLDPNRTAAALLVEVLVLLLLPLVPVGALVIWAGEWAAALHMTGRNHDLAFHLGRILQSLLVLFFLYRWVRSMIPVQGAIAASMVRGR